jgi:YNFM family putative membrane transporter
MVGAEDVRDGAGGMAGFLLGATGMFATMYSTQAILPELGRAFDVSPSRAGLTISAVVLMLAVGAWAWGPVSDRIGRKRSIVVASSLLVVPTVAAGLAPNFPTLLVCRGLQGLCMPGLLTVGVPYVMEVFGRRYGGRAMGAYVTSLVVGGLIGRVGVGLVSAALGWRWSIAGLAALPLVGATVMYRTLPDEPTIRRGRGGLRSLAVLLRNRQLLQATAAGASVFFTFVGVFSFVVYRLEGPPFGFGTAAGSLIFLLWVVGAIGPVAGGIADRHGWQRLVLVALSLSAIGVAVTLATSLVAIVVGLALVATAMFGGVTAAQLGVAGSTDLDRGVASAVYFSVYYAAGSLGGYLPGLAWQAWQWSGVVVLALAVLGAGIALQLLIHRRRRRPPEHAGPRPA